MSKNSASNSQKQNETLQRILARAKGLSFYADRYKDIDITSVSANDLSALPFTTREDLVNHFKANEPDGGFLQEDIVQMHLTPAPDIGKMPEYLTSWDLAQQATASAEQFSQCNIGSSDRCLVVFSYHMLAGGWLFHEGLTKLGATVLALGPTDAETIIEIAKQHNFNVLVSNPSFAKKIGEAGGKFETLLAAGEPFSAVPNYKEDVESLLGCTAYDAYGLSETGVVAAQTVSGDGMAILDSSCILEVLDEQTLEPVADGEKGEIVVTSLTREGMPILRFRTGDLTLKDSKDGKIILPRGVFGRTDSMVKLKGVKFYPKELLFILAATPGINFRSYQVVCSHNASGTDHVVLRLEGEAGTDTTELAQRIRSATGIGMNEIRIEEKVEGDLVVDERF